MNESLFSISSTEVNHRTRQLSALITALLLTIFILSAACPLPVKADGGPVVDGFGEHGFDDTDIISHFRGVGKQLAHPSPTLSVLPELVW